MKTNQQYQLAVCSHRLNQPHLLYTSYQIQAWCEELPQPKSWHVCSQEWAKLYMRSKTGLMGSVSQDPAWAVLSWIGHLHIWAKWSHCVVKNTQNTWTNAKSYTHKQTHIHASTAHAHKHHSADYWWLTNDQFWLVALVWIGTDWYESASNWTQTELDACAQPTELE